MLLIPMINIAEINDPANILEKMQFVQQNEIANVNWPDEFPSKPKVTFKMAHNGTHLFLQYFVEENEVLAKTEIDNGPVWTDSCVEFFISFDNSSYYYNAEFSCIGKALLAYRPGRENAIHADAGIMNSIKRYSSLGAETFGSRKGDFEWNLLVVIPVSAYWKSDIKTFSGVTARANFYKCGDNLATPHYLSWNPILTEKPDFHIPQFFGELKFE
ncbi:MAG: carbohydrate-binding family 9-like protein [Dysgonomonas sp.]